jgi:hemerythrin
MQEHGFPGLSSHRARHDIFRKKIATLIEDFRASKPGVPVSLLLFLQTWLKDHLLKTDKLYSAYLNARGVR